MSYLKPPTPKVGLEFQADTESPLLVDLGV